jgi:DNA (cytosine-5)-methyltransferase 1
VKTVPTIDLFAGPGGLSEGFARAKISDLKFDVRLSIEKDEVACRTLMLRAFVRQFAEQSLPEAYYQYVRGDRTKLAELQSMPQWHAAESHIRRWTLGESNPGAEGYVSPEELHATIHEALAGSEDWVLLGGPPCQAYSVAGRARMTGVGAKVRSSRNRREIAATHKRLEKAFAADRRHTLYREYLRIVAVHQPGVFVMENVKGILSSVLPGGTREDGERFALDQILDDLRNPWAALADDPSISLLQRLAASYAGSHAKYSLHSFVSPSSDLFGELDRNAFVVRSEEHGVPQRRHRVIILGVRSDVRGVSIPVLTPRKESTSVRQVLSGMPKLRSALSNLRSPKARHQDDNAENWCAAIAAEVSRFLRFVNDGHIAARIRKIAIRASVDWPVGGSFFSTNQSLGSAPPELREWLSDKRLGGVIQHISRSHMASDLGRYLFLAASADHTKPEKQRSLRIADWPTYLLPRHSNVRRVARNRGIRASGFHDRFRVQVWDAPASTITSHIHKDGHYFIHPGSRAMPQPYGSRSSAASDISGELLF